LCLGQFPDDTVAALNNPVWLKLAYFFHLLSVNGTLFVRSFGSRVWVELGYRACRMGISGAAMSSNVMTVVVADDDSLLRETFRAFLEARGYNVLLAEDGNDALKIVESTTVDAMLLDILMPRKEGLETLIELKQRFPALKVFVMSGGGLYGRADFLTVARKFGADAVLRKPFPLQSVIELLERRDRPVQRAS